MALGQHFITQNSLEIHEVGSSFYRLRRTENDDLNDEQMQAK